jgi:UDP-N-acetylmuramoyl-tripeptide--D-alanyl-D-alanine ligase
VGNALAAAAVALERGASLEQVAAALGGAAAVSGRRMAVRTRADGVTVVDDAYNANPDSVRAALKALVTMARDTAGGPPRRSWAVLGEMGELGPDSVREHDAVGRFVVRLLVDRLVVVGPPSTAEGAARDGGEPATALHRGAVMEGSWGRESLLVGSVAEAVELLEAEVEPGDVVLVKASQSVGLWRVADALLAHETQEEAP